MSESKKCARTACNLPAQGWIHKHDGREYCAKCARNINSYDTADIVTPPAEFNDWGPRQPSKDPVERLAELEAIGSQMEGDRWE